MIVIWTRRRGSMRILRALLLLGAALGVAVGAEVIRRTYTLEISRVKGTPNVRAGRRRRRSSIALRT